MPTLRDLIAAEDQRRAAAPAPEQESMEVEPVATGPSLEDKIAAEDALRSEERTMRTAAREQESESVLSRITKTGFDVVRTINQGLLVGAGDEVKSALSAAYDSATGDVSFGEAYETSLATERERLKNFRAENPVISTILEMAGALPTAIAVPGGAAAGAARSIVSRVATGAAAGGATGAAYGFAQGEGGAKERMESAVLPGAAGTVLGAAAAPVAKGVGKIAERVTGRSEQAATGMAPETAGIIRESVRSDMRGGAERMARAGNDAMLADIGPNTKALLDVAVQKSGPAGAAARQAIDDRVTLASTNVRDSLDTALGRPEGLKTVEKGLKARSQPAVGAAYNEAYSRTIDFASAGGQQIEELVVSRVPESVIKNANKLMRLEGEKTKQIKVLVGDDGSIAGFEAMPDVRQVDYITRALFNRAEKESAKGKMGGTTQEGRAFNELAKELRLLTREAVPEYDTALKLAAEPIRARNSLKLGRDVFGKKAPDEIAEDMAGMTDMERKYVAQGAREAIDESMAKVKAVFTDSDVDTREVSKTLKELSSRGSREKLRIVIGDDAADDLFKTLDQATVAFELKAAVHQNSKTFARQNIDAKVGRRVEGGPTGAVLQGEPLKAARELMKQVTGRDAASMDKKTERIMLDVAEALLRRGSMKDASGLVARRTPKDRGKSADAIATRAATAPVAATGQMPR